MRQKQALELLKTGRNIFVTGAAGSGKTYLINSYIDFLRKHDVDVGITASTGIAATHMGGVTIHSWSGIGISSDLTESDIEGMSEKAYLKKRFEKVKVLIIDEISMLHHFRLDLVDQVLRSMKGVSDPFGGIQVVLCGDFFQLPPVSRFGERESYFVFQSESWRNAGFTICYLEEQFRQTGDKVTSILNEIRSGDVGQDSRKLLESRMNKRTLQIEPTKLYTHNRDVDIINFEELERLGTVEEAEYFMDSKGKSNIVETLKKSCLAHPILRLKVGARVMCVKNNFEEGYVNGTLGVVHSCGQFRDPVVRLANGKLITIEKASWKIEEDGKTKAEINQYPLRLAWAITVHKSQGMSLDAVEVDLAKSFEPGMGYVALSRVRSLDGLTILGLNEMALSVNNEVLEFDKKLRQSSQKVEETLLLTRPEIILADQKDFLEYITPKKKKEAKLSSQEETALLIEKRMSLSEMAKERGMVPETIVDHIEKLLKENADIDIRYLRNEISHAHWMKIDKVFNEILEKEDVILLGAAKQKLGANISYLKIRLARALRGFVPESNSKPK